MVKESKRRKEREKGIVCVCVCVCAAFTASKVCVRDSSREREDWNEKMRAVKELSYSTQGQKKRERKTMAVVKRECGKCVADARWTGDPQLLWSWLSAGRRATGDAAYVCQFGIAGVTHVSHRFTHKDRATAHTHTCGTTLSKSTATHAKNINVHM